MFKHMRMNSKLSSWETKQGYALSHYNCFVSCLELHWSCCSSRGSVTKTNRLTHYPQADTLSKYPITVPERPKGAKDEVNGLQLEVWARIAPRLLVPSYILVSLFWAQDLFRREILPYLEWYGDWRGHTVLKTGKLGVRSNNWSPSTGPPGPA